MTTHVTGKCTHFVPLMCGLKFPFFFMRKCGLSRHQSHLEAISLRQKQQLFLGATPTQWYRLLMITLYNICSKWCNGLLSVCSLHPHTRSMWAKSLLPTHAIWVFFHDNTFNYFLVIFLKCCSICIPQVFLPSTFNPSCILDTWTWVWLNHEIENLFLDSL